MKTLQWVVDPEHLDTAEAREAIGHAAEILRTGGLVALPTETVYGLGANALDAEAVARIFAAKRRPDWDPVIVHVSDEAMLAGLVLEVPQAARRLMEAFWPGPLTLLLPRSPAVPDGVTAGRPLVGVRMPAHPVALELIRRAGVPVAAPSANLFGHISPTTAAHVLQDLDGRIDAILDGGPTGHGVESTVLDPALMVIYRPGAVTAEQIQAIAGPVTVFAPGALVETPPESLPSPGVGIRHYAPRARLVLVEGELDVLQSRLAEAALRWPEEKIGVMLPSELALALAVAPLAPPVPPEFAAEVFAWGRWAAPEELARDLYAGLRALDAQGCSVILCPVPPGEGIAAAIRDRLAKAGVKD